MPAAILIVAAAIGPCKAQLMHVIIDLTEPYVDDCVRDKQMSACVVCISIDALVGHVIFQAWGEGPL